VRGAYTNAHGAREGLVAEAEGGTLLLDDVDCLPLAAQSKLLRFLQEREYRPLGSNRVKRADLRVIASTNRDLRDLCAKGLFRQDLYYRLNVLSLTLPPLRERREDIALLARHFAAVAGKRFGRPGVSVGQATLRKLMSHDWPGNVRELQHAIERAVLMASRNAIDDVDLQLTEAAAAADTPASFRAAKARVVEQFERTFIEQRLLECGGNVTHAARDARKNRRAFFELMRKHSIEPERYRSAK
jgi:DNA-binding NtrC family response regulator